MRGRGVFASLHAVAAELVHRLRRQAEMRAHRHVALAQRTDHFDSPAAPPSSFTIAAPPSPISRAAVDSAVALSRALRNGMSAISNARVDAARHACGVVDHLVERHRQRARMALHHHAERIADQHDVDAGRIQLRGETGVIAGQRRRFFRRAASSRAARQRSPACGAFGLRLHGMRVPREEAGLFRAQRSRRTRIVDRRAAAGIDARRAVRAPAAGPGRPDPAASSASGNSTKARSADADAARAARFVA